MSDVSDKWGTAIAERGFAQVPNHLLLANQFMDPRLSPVELLVLIQLAGSWWKKEQLPFPSVATLAKRCGVSDRQIQRAVAALEKRHLVRRVQRRSEGLVSSNAYDLQPLVIFLERIAKAFPNAFPRNIQPQNGIASREVQEKKKHFVLRRAAPSTAQRKAEPPIKGTGAARQTGKDNPVKRPPPKAS
jgi:hypothetical protein